MSIVLVIAMVLSLAACGGDSGNKESNAPSGSAEESKGSEATQGGTLKIGMSTDASEAAAWRMRSGQEKLVFSAVYEPLMKIDDDGNVVGYLAKSLEADEANLTYTCLLYTSRCV